MKAREIQLLRFVRDQAEAVASSTNHRIGGVFAGTAHFVYRFGRQFIRPLTEMPEEVRYDRPKDCFRNAAVLAMEHPEKFTYVEGYALHLIGVIHAWCLDREGRVVDPTWHKLHDFEQGAYLGIPIRTQYLFNMMQREKAHYGLLDDYMNGWEWIATPTNQWKHPEWELENRKLKHERAGSKRLVKA